MQALKPSAHGPTTAGPRHTSTLAPATRQLTEAEEREVQRHAYYATYDYMTGIRIAYTLGAFFGLMVFLVVYKSRSKSHKALKDPKIAAVAAAAVAEAEEQERRELQAALEATAYYSYAGTARAGRRARQSLGNMSVPILSWRRGSPRFSSVGGGYCSLLAPPRRLSCYRANEPCLDGLKPLENINGFPHEYCVDTGGDEEDSLAAAGPSGYCHFLRVPQGSRRSSNITCSSSDSSYLERRGSAVVLGLPAVPTYYSNKLRGSHVNRRRSSANYHDTNYWDFYYPIDIQVIQATPNLTPCPSERNIYDEIRNYDINSYKNGVHCVENSSIPRRMAPLASIGSCGVSLSVDYQDSDLHSLGSDSVFMEDYADTDEDLEEFSSDSDKIPHTISNNTQTLSKSKKRSVSSNEIIINEQNITPPSTSCNLDYVSANSTLSVVEHSRSASESRPQLPLPEGHGDVRNHRQRQDESVGRDNISDVELPIIRSGDQRDCENPKWSEETLF